LTARAEQRWAVDPKFKATLKEQIKKSESVWPFFRREWFFEMTSDEFFVREAKRLNRKKIDLAFVDGLHTYEQSYRDVLNCLLYLRAGGVILLHDCHPTSESMAYPAPSYGDAAAAKLAGWTKEWCGDVWKTIVYLRSCHLQLNVFVLDCDYGVGVITRGEPESVLPYSPEDIRQMDYRDLADNRQRFLNLKQPEYLETFIKKRSSVRIRERRCRSGSSIWT